ncbi:MAG: hypothetical protein M3R23_06200 [Actinomycetota bacterium]|nr:hypothetical protein [Actinomycetota bacterium]
MAVDLLDAPARVLADRPRALMGTEAGVVVDRVVGEVRGYGFDVTGIESVVVRANVVEIRQVCSLLLVTRS